ncbi:MAG: hypothetical protein JJU10_05285 [Idiomarina sp.]|nr:hypothetical protein [Idiomarina sp.]
MIFEFDVRPYLVTAADMESFEEEAEHAADQFNGLLYSAAEAMQESDYWTAERAEQLIVELSANWVREPALVEADLDELGDHVQQLIRRIEQEHDGDE